MKKRVVFTMFVLAILVPAEVEAWLKLAPIFWAPGVAYTQLGWGYPLLALLFIFLPVAAIGAIWED